MRVRLGRNAIHGAPADLSCTGLDAVTTVLVRASSPDRQLPVGLLAGYLDRYGVRSDSVRVTTHSAPPGTTTWIGLTLRAADNLVALQARSVQTPLRQTAESAARRLVGQLQENRLDGNTCRFQPGTGAGGGGGA